MMAFSWLMRILVLAVILGWAVSAFQARSERASPPAGAHLGTATP